MDCYEHGISFTRKHKGLQDNFTNAEPEILTEAELDSLDPHYEKYLQDDFQDTIIENIFTGIAEYVDRMAIPLCEYITRDDIEDIIDALEKS
jgi:hypothetical protein